MQGTRLSHLPFFKSIQHFGYQLTLHWTVLYVNYSMQSIHAKHMDCMHCVIFVWAMFVLLLFVTKLWEVSQTSDSGMGDFADIREIVNLGSIL